MVPCQKISKHENYSQSLDKKSPLLIFKTLNKMNVYLSSVQDLVTKTGNGK